MPLSSRSRFGSAPASGDSSVLPCARAHANPGCPEHRVRLSESGPARAAPSVLVVFADHTACPWLRPLRRGFRHCFVAFRAGPLWLACEPLKDRIQLDALDLPPDFDLAAFYGEQGHRVLLGRRPPPGPRRPFALAPLTCVTVVKRLLGITAPWVWTPWQLYTYLSEGECGFTAWSGPPVCTTALLETCARNSA